MPLIGIYLLNKYNEMIHIDKEEDGIFLNVTNGVTMPIYGLLLRVLFDINIEITFSFWAITIMLSSILSYFFYRKNEIILKEKGVVFIFFIFTLMYICCFTVMANQHLDTSNPDEISRQITDKYDSGSDSKSYYLKFKPLLLYNDIDEVSITESEFNKLEIGDEVTIVIHIGLFNLYRYDIK